MWIDSSFSSSDSAPAVSVVMPCFKSARYVAETLESLAAQNFTDWELVAVEDGLADGTAEIVRAFAARVSQPVRYLKHAQNQGLPATRNTAIAASRGRWLALLDSDDIWLPDHLQKTLAKAAETGVELIFGGSILFDDATGADLEERVPSAESLTRLPLSLFLNELIIQPSSLLFLRSVYDRIGGFEPSMRYVEDLDFYFRALRLGFRMGYAGEITLRYRKHGESLSARSLLMAAYMAEVYGRQTDWIELPSAARRRRIGNAFESAGRMAFRSHPVQSTVLFWRGWKSHPRQVKFLAFVLASLGLSLWVRVKSGQSFLSPAFRGEFSRRLTHY